jgi:hypothetical protein
MAVHPAAFDTARRCPNVHLKHQFPYAQGKNDEVLKRARAARRGCELAPSTPPEGLEIATVAGGCFWGLELAYQRLPGVVQTSVGYTAGQVPNPTYEEVCSGRTGHTEAVQVRRRKGHEAGGGTGRGKQGRVQN